MNWSCTISNILRNLDSDLKYETSNIFDVKPEQLHSEDEYIQNKRVDGYKVVYSESAYVVADTSTLML
jgi:hypothetical protein